MSRAWRSKPAKSLWATPIYTKDFSKLARAMAEDGLTFSLVNKGNGYVWLVADYEIPTKSVRQVWGLTAPQMRRFVAWLLENKSELTEENTWE